MEKSNDKKHEAQMKKDDSNAPAPKKIMLDPWIRQFPYNQLVSNHAQTSLLDERSLKRHSSSRNVNNKRKRNKINVTK
jgi:hypothetical protein